MKILENQLRTLTNPGLRQDFQGTRQRLGVPQNATAPEFGYNATALEFGYNATAPEFGYNATAPEFGYSLYPEGIPTSSPGLRGTSYPGKQSSVINPEVGCGRPGAHTRHAATLFGVDGIAPMSQGSRRPQTPWGNPGLEAAIPLGLTGKMGQTLRRIAFLALGAAFLCANSAPAQAPGKKLSYETFRMVRSRNVFDPERQPGAIPAPPTPTAGPISHADFAALTGTLITSERTLAFFSGSRPEFNAVLSVSGTIAGAAVVAITQSGIEVTRGGKRVSVAVGQTVPLDANSAPGPAPVDAPASVPLISGSAAPGAPSTLPPISADKDVILRRMMERRQRELK